MTIQLPILYIAASEQLAGQAESFKVLINNYKIKGSLEKIENTPKEKKFPNSHKIKIWGSFFNG